MRQVVVFIRWVESQLKSWQLSFWARHTALYIISRLYANSFGLHQKHCLREDSNDLMHFVHLKSLGTQKRCDSSYIKNTLLNRHALHATLYNVQCALSKSS